MRSLLREDLLRTPGWSDLFDELDQWLKSGRVASLWWRDDDAVMPSPRLDRLISIAGNVPISLAVIPATAGSKLAAWAADLSQSSQVTSLSVLQHGWRHANYNLGGKKSEFPPGRSRRDVRLDLITGRARLTAFFGSCALPVLVPPWNRFPSCFLPLLPACGLCAISRVKPRRAPCPALGITEVNVHIDLIAWAEDRGFIGEEAAIDGIVSHLRARRLGKVDTHEPTGILTHHLVQDEATSAFLSRLVAITKEHPATRWLDAAEIFADAICNGR